MPTEKYKVSMELARLGKGVSETEYKKWKKTDMDKELERIHKRIYTRDSSMLRNRHRTAGASTEIMRRGLDYLHMIPTVIQNYNQIIKEIENADKEIKEVSTLYREDSFQDYKAVKVNLLSIITCVDTAVIIMQYVENNTTIV